MTIADAYVYSLHLRAQAKAMAAGTAGHVGAICAAVGLRVALRALPVRSVVDASDPLPLLAAEVYALQRQELDERVRELVDAWLELYAAHAPPTMAERFESLGGGAWSR